MKYTEKEFVALLISMALFMLAIVWQIIFGYPTDEQLAVVGVVWIIAACVSGTYSWYLQSKDEV